MWKNLLPNKPVKLKLKKVKSINHINQAKDKVVETTMEAAGKVDESAHKHSWYFTVGS